MEQETKVEKMVDVNGVSETAPTMCVQRELNAIVDKTKKSIVTCLTEKPDIFDGDIDINEVDHIFVPYAGDKIKLIVYADLPTKVIAIEPLADLQKYSGKITQQTKSYAIIDDDIAYFIPDDTTEFHFKKGDPVECVIIEGNYSIGKDMYELRCERITTIDTASEEIKRWFVQPLDTIEEANSDTDTENAAGQQKMNFEALKGKEPSEEWYDLPYGLYETLRSDNLQRIKKKLLQIVPPELDYSTYKKRFHAHVYLEEVEMQLSFEKYKSREICIQPEKKRFSIVCTKITELRPPISVGDRIVVRKLSTEQSYYYRGTVERVLPDRFILKFRPDFVSDFRLGEPFSAQFYHNRVVFQRKHAAIDYAKLKLSKSFLFPKVFTPAKNNQLNAEIVDGKLHLNGKETAWFKDLNEEQKEAVAVALRGECRPLPLIIFGPPGTGKTSTLIEIILQVYTHMPNCKILIATQSNHAANVVATRLVSCNPDIGSDMLRLISNAMLDRQKLPKELHKFSASVLHAHAEDIDEDDEVFYADIPKNVKRNCHLSYLKKFRIIVGTCVGLGILFNSEFSDKYFTHVFIDEAAQCSECEAMIPITNINPDGGQIILAGDPLQLPPISLSNHAKQYNLVNSMLQRYIDTYKMMENINSNVLGGFDSRLVVRLRRNYRAIPTILEYYNKRFYDSQLISTVDGSTSLEAKKLKELRRVWPQITDFDSDEPFGILFFNVEGRNERLENKKSWENKEEAALIKSFIGKLLTQNIEQDDIGVITPYHAQMLALRKGLKSLKKVRVGTVEEFQGEEKMVIVFSAVKTSGLEKALQFIFCPKRLNTAISRARMLVAVFGKASLLQKDPNWNELIEYCHQHNTFIEGKEIVQIL